MSHPSADELAVASAGRTVASQFVETVARLGSAPALRWKDGPGWSVLSWTEFADRVARAATGLTALGVRRGDRVVLMMRNTPQFHVLDTALVYCGATPISIYNSSPVDQVEYLTRHCEASVAIAGEPEFGERFAAARSRLPRLRWVGAVDGDGDFTYRELLRAEPMDLPAAAAAVAPTDLATVIYTSGTTGPPKGVMITHRNIAWTLESLRRAFGTELSGRRIVSYLPMAHIAERMNSLYQAIFYGYDVATCPDVAVLGPYCREVRPEIFFGVPRVWEKFHAAITGSIAADADRRAKFDEAVAAAAPIAVARTDETITPEQERTWQFLDEVAFKPLRASLGFDALFCGVSGAAPITAELLSWFRTIGVPLSEIYGLSETSGPLTWDRVRVRPGTVGRAMPGCEVKLAADGEVLCRGGNVFSGYLNDPVKTAETLDSEGFLHTGDVGVLDADGYLRIVDRKREIIITTGGKNISPANLEATLKLVPLIGQAAVIGDRRPFVTALLVLDPEGTTAFAAREGVSFSSFSDLARDDKVLAAIEAGVTSVMRRFNHAEQVKRWTVLADEWLPDSDELTPTSKLKRRSIESKYAALIETMYD